MFAFGAFIPLLNGGLYDLEPLLGDRIVANVRYELLSARRGTGLIGAPDSFLDVHRADVASLAARHRLPAVYPFRQFAEVGGLLSYGNDQLDNFRRAAVYADRILRGAKPSELPVQAPVKFELVINLKTAKALGIDVPLQLKQRADDVIE
jgi:putative tryptophan/tyrosine transport system substrate-binding protein